jgi:hypothetical protein
MSDAGPHAVRQTRTGQWQVSLINASQWHTCLSELDARYIANGLHLAAAVKRGERHGEEIADELEEAASVVQRNLGNNWAERIIKAAASEARGVAVADSLRSPVANPIS